MSRNGARPAWYKRRPAELWVDLALLPRDAAALHLLLSDLAFMLGTLPENEDEVRRVAGVSDTLWNSWGVIRHLWPVTGLRRGCTRGRMNPAVGGAFSEAAGAVAVYRKRAKAGAAGLWKKKRALDASSNASGALEGMQRERVEESKSREEENKERAPECAPVSSSSGRSGWKTSPKTNSLVGKSTLPVTVPKLRDPLAPGGPDEVRKAAEKRVALNAYDAALISGTIAPKPEPFHGPKHYGPDSRTDERVRLAEWEEGDDEAFTRNREQRSA